MVAGDGGFVLGRLLSCLPFPVFVSEGRNGSIFLDKSCCKVILQVCCAFSYRFFEVERDDERKSEERVERFV